MERIAIYNNLNELVEAYIKANVLLSEEEIADMRNCNMVIEDIVPSGHYTELDDGRIIIH